MNVIFRVICLNGYFTLGCSVFGKSLASDTLSEITGSLLAFYRPHFECNLRDMFGIPPPFFVFYI